ncbi:NAD(P)H-hydrate dehydratase [Planosporangium flavigriseum]|uniref:ADP-dependent (S)-NAD(P)H-hydrate dehydratase n=1 Tax=Planosporangium flavigriseum TaxID=373681 RepID=A0A8J3LRI1_9ACTN|nr:NAD(P)H-hydrate dehydratase [Planosporangium flavigriseum]NJC66799.1 NAD(P)H-hydrate dehydratase [Planosporangium flavigriseum]GIG76289.1 ADP-dependent (S)-NAD(P)H-hydrate dehydratase [Planosporangium flavigriseum]
MPNRSEPVVITPRLLREWPLPVPEGDKASRGTVLVIGGSRFNPGAVLLAGVAALRSGAGVLQLAAAESTAAALSIQVPEAFVVGLPETAEGSVAGKPPERLADLAEQAQAIAVGPGLDNIDETRALLRQVLDAAGPETALVLDAYALGALSHDRDLLSGRKQPVVLTPNLVEAKFLLGREPGDDLSEAAATLADRYGAVVSLFGHIAAPDGRTWREESGDAGLGTSGSGDVRAGIVAGLLSRGADPAQAACWAAYAHAGSGQRLAPRFGRIGFLAREILDEVPHTLAELSAG